MITVGSRVGAYTVLRLLGQGGMGQVYLAQHHRIARQVAVKVLLPELSSNQGVIERFFTEAQATSLIRHPGIVEVIDCDVLDGQAYIVMEYLEGESLAGYLARLGSRVDVPFALAMVGQVAAAVGAAHGCGIVHRDLKPDNVFLCSNPRDARVVPKVLDFGIAKVALQGAIAQTRTGAIMGTPAYMSPEQCRGGSKAVDARSDVYSLGCILYEALCGRPPFVREGVGDMIVAHVAEAPDPPRSLVPDLPAAPVELVMRMLAKNPEDRPPTMATVSSEILRCLESIAVRTSLVEIEPRQPVLYPAREGNGPIGALTPSVGRTPPLPSADVRTPPPPAAPSSPPPTTFRGAVGERTRPPEDVLPVRSSSRKWAVGAAALAALGGLAIVLKLMADRPAPAPEIARPPSVAAPVVAAPAALPPAAVPPAAVPPAAVPQTVSVDLRGLPAGAEVLVDGAPASGLPLKLKRDARPHLLLVRANGYQNRTLEIEASRDRVVELPMIAVAKPEKHRAAASPRADHPRTAAATSPSPTVSPRKNDTTPAQKVPPNNGQKSNYDDM